MGGIGDGDTSGPKFSRIFSRFFQVKNDQNFYDFSRFFEVFPGRGTTTDPQKYGMYKGIKEFTKELRNLLILQELRGAVLNFVIPENALHNNFLEHTKHKALLRHLCLLPLLGNTKESKVQTKVELRWDHSYL